jgi:hypothetical protein
MTDRDDYADLERLLPFYVNGTLDPAQRAQVDLELAGSAPLRAALAEETANQARVVAATEETLAASAGGLEARHATLAARLPEPTVPPRVAPLAARPDRFAAALAFLNPRRWHPAVALSLALLIPLQGAVIASQAGKLDALRDENFQLASGPCEDRPLAGAVQLELADGAKWQEIAALLDAEQLSIAKSGQFGTLTVKTGKQGAELTALLARLRKSPLVASAEAAA